jgi:hypothetical protein
MTQEDQVFVADVMVIDLMWETMVLNVISQPTDAAMELSTIAKIHKF